jgi:hypothetical protein
MDDESGRLSSDGPKATGTTQYLNEYLDFEEYITALMILPRALDGVYEFQDKITLKEFKGQLFYTALINMKDKFYWVTDIAENLVKSFKNNLTDEQISTIYGLTQIFPSEKNEEMYLKIKLMKVNN